MPKWVGFDMDECIGSVMPLYAFVSGLDNAHMPGLLRTLYKSEKRGTTWLIRPAIYDALRMLYRAWQRGAVLGAFIFSNNGSQSLVTFIAAYLNSWMVRQFVDPTAAHIFQMAVCRGSPLRSPQSLVKSYKEIQGSLAGAGLPLLDGPQDLLFFDDMDHALMEEIPNYVKVRPYMNQCPLENVINGLRDCSSILGAEEWERRVDRARSYEKMENGHEYLATPPTAAETASDRTVFQAAFRRFLGESAIGGRRRYSRRNRANRVRKNTRRNR